MAAAFAEEICRSSATKAVFLFQTAETLTHFRERPALERGAHIPLNHRTLFAMNVSTGLTQAE
jgi:hypothetical protein